MAGGLLAKDEEGFRCRVQGLRTKPSRGQVEYSEEQVSGTCMLISFDGLKPVPAICDA